MLTCRAQERDDLLTLGAKVREIPPKPATGSSATGRTATGRTATGRTATGRTATGRTAKDAKPSAGTGYDWGVPVSGSYDQRAVARQAADLVAADLSRICGLLEEVATLWRRAQLYGQQSSPIAPGSLQEAARRLADALRLLPDADSSERPALAFAAVAQLGALENNAARAAAMTADRRLGDAGIWAAVEGALLHVWGQLWDLITRLAEIGEPFPAEDSAAGWKAVTWTDPLTMPARGSRERHHALAIQRAAIDALPEGELRRLLVLIGGMDPAVLQRAAVIYTETFSAVAEMKSSVTALRPVALAVPGNYPQGIGP
jgi:hypothetical protein